MTRRASWFEHGSFRRSPRRHRERSEAIQATRGTGRGFGWLRRFAPRNDGAVRLKVAIGAALAAALGVAVPEAALALGDKVETGSCSVATVGNASNNIVTCNFDMPPEKLKELIEAATKGGEAPILDRLVQVSKTLGVTEDAAKTLLKIVGQDPNVAEDKLAEALTKVANDYKRLQAQAAALNPENPTARALVDAGQARDRRRAFRTRA